MSAIPCLSYRRALEEEKRLKEAVLQTENGDKTHDENEIKSNNDNAENSSSCPYANGESKSKNNGSTTTSSNDDIKEENNIDKPPVTKKPRIFGAFSNAKIETVKENLKEQSLTVQQINDYCKSLFIFKNIRVMRFT